MGMATGIVQGVRRIPLSDLSKMTDQKTTGAPETLPTETAAPAVAEPPVVEMPVVEMKGPEQKPGEIGGPQGPEPTRYGDWAFKGRCSDF
jgi:hypothetical protein